jgi:2',3'-cyclic-nucleotide 2'-phosphodiesterase (5'-nucleotidase family)
VADLTILHTNDAHNRFHRRWAEHLGRLKEEADHTLLLDAGDAVGSGNFGWKPWGEGALTWMNRAGYDAMNLGNREFHVWRGALQAKIGRARFPVLCANLRPRKEGWPVGLERQQVLHLPNGLRVGLFGLLGEMVKPTARLARFSHFVFDPPQSVAQEVVQHLKPAVDVVIGLSHLGLERDRRLVATVEGIDLLVGGHSHTPLEQPERVGQTWIAQAAPYLQSVGRIDLAVQDGQVRLVEGRLLLLRRK